MTSLFLLALTAFACEDVSVCGPDALSVQDLNLLKDTQVILKSDLTQICTNENCQMMTWAKGQFVDKPHCAEFFINGEGKLGRLATLVATEIANDVSTNGQKSVFLKRYGDIDKICPGYVKMRPSTKVGFWTWFFEVLAFAETSCDPTKINSGTDVPHGPAVCLYQLNKDPSLRSWRGPRCAVSAQQILTPEACTACAVDIMKRSMSKNTNIFATRLADGTLRVPRYFESLNPPNPKKAKDPDHPYWKFQRRLPRFPLCSTKGQ